MIMSIFGLLFDLVKILFRCILQIVARLFCIRRKWRSSISLFATLDVIPRNNDQKLNKLVIGKRSNIEKRCTINTWYGDIVLEDRTGIGIGSVVIGPVTMHKGSAFAQNCFVTGISHHFKDISQNFRHQGFKVKEVVLEEDAMVGSNSVVLPGVRIGKNSVVGAGSVVTKDIPPYSVAVGNPAKVISRYDQEKKKWIRTTDSNTQDAIALNQVIQEKGNISSSI